ncbi:MAG: DUF262 domain-containing protein [Bacteroidia bacterium]|nr:DUF262 domain-containing protein [Bacteroidia bacterium]
MNDVFLNAQQVEDIFKKHIKTTVNSFSIKSLFSDRMINRIDYTPYYQRNYVWDSTKATFFIESILLGTDIPPLIFFNNGKKIEVIDGRQRFETIKNFKMNNLKLSSKGLTKLPQLKTLNFSKMEPEIQNIFDNAKIRFFEFEVINEPKLDLLLEDKVKKEIFRRYNSGITPLSKAELENATYDDDTMTNILKNELNKDEILISELGNKFLIQQDISMKTNSADILQFLRKFLVLSSFPINTYAAGNNRRDVLDLLYSFKSDNIENHEEACTFLLTSLKDAIKLINMLDIHQIKTNKYLNECLLWAIVILKEEEINIECLYKKENLDYMKKYLIEHINDFSSEGTYFYRAIINRHKVIVDMIKHFVDFSFDIYFKNENFKDKIDQIIENKQDVKLKLEELSSLRVLKPDASLMPIHEITNDLITNQYLVRPSYQRQEKTNEYKASAIIESIILGINLPPIFIYKNENGIKEVVDGQQRLLSILGFLGKQYKDETGKLVYPKINNFKLKRLKILKNEYNNLTYNELDSNTKDKILDFNLSIIEIDYKLNNNFDPVDLFIRLNSKPYPIKDNSFEMWNSFVDKDVIEKIKILTNEHVSWFFIKQRQKDKTDRMLNEELIALLSYLVYNSEFKSNKSSLGFYERDSMVNCRIKDKKDVSAILEKITADYLLKKDFIESIDRVEYCINRLKQKLDPENMQRSLSLLFNKDSGNYKRYLVDFYLLFEILQRLSVEALEKITYQDLQEKLYKVQLELKNPKKPPHENLQDYFISFIDNVSQNTR